MNCPMAAARLPLAEPRSRLCAQTIEEVAASLQEFSESDKIQLINHHHQAPLSLPATNGHKQVSNVLYQPHQNVKQAQNDPSGALKALKHQQVYDQTSAMRERLFRLLSKVPIQVETIKRQQSREYDLQSASLSSSSSSSSNKPQRTYNSREPLIIKYYHERSLNELIDLHFACSLADQHHQEDHQQWPDSCEFAPSNHHQPHSQLVSFGPTQTNFNTTGSHEMTSTTTTTDYNLGEYSSQSFNWATNTSWPNQSSKTIEAQSRRIKLMAPKAEFIGQQRQSFSQLKKLNKQHQRHQSALVCPPIPVPPPLPLLPPPPPPPPPPQPGNLANQYSDSLAPDGDTSAYHFAAGNQTIIAGQFYDQFNNQPFLEATTTPTTTTTSVQSFGPANYSPSLSCHFTANQINPHQPPPVAPTAAHTTTNYNEPEMLTHYQHQPMFEVVQQQQQQQHQSGHEANLWHQQAQLQAQPQFFVSSETHQMIELGHNNNHHFINQHNDVYLVDHQAAGYSAPIESSFESSYGQVSQQSRPQVQLTIAHHHLSVSSSCGTSTSSSSSSSSSTSSLSSSSSSSSTSSSSTSSAASTSSLQLNNVKQTAAANLVS